MSHKTLRRMGPIRLGLFGVVIGFVVGLLYTIPFLALKPSGEPRLIDSTGTTGTAGASHHTTIPETEWWPAVLIIPLIYAISSGALVALGAMIYNFLAARFGGVRIEIDD